MNRSHPALKKKEKRKKEFRLNRNDFGFI